MTRVAIAPIVAFISGACATALKRPLKIVLWTTLSVIAIVLTGIVLLVDPDDFKPIIVRTVYEKKQRTLNFEDPIKLRVFPRIALDLGRVSLSEYRRPEVFMSVEKAELAVAWLPLLKKRLVIEGVSLEGISARVIRYADGTFNFADLLQQESPSQIDFDIATLRATNSTVVFEDRKSARTYTVQKLALATGRLANGRETSANLTGQLSARQAPLALAFNARTQLTFDTRARRYQARNLDFTARGKAMHYTDLALRVQGDAELGKMHKRGANLQFVADAKRGEWRDHAEFKAPAWAIESDGLAFEKPTAGMRFERGQTRIALDARSDRLLQQPGAWSAGNVVYALAWQLGGNAVRGQINSSLAIDTATRTATFDDLSSVLGVSGERWKDGGFKLNLRGRMVYAPSGKPVVSATLGALAHTTRAQVQLALDRTAPAHFSFNAKLDKLELDRFLRRAPAKNVAEAQAFKIPDLNSDGDIMIGELSHGSTRAQGVRIEVRDE